MPNQIPAVERIVAEMRKGWPDGTFELHREIPTLIARIEELERALIPFARIATAEATNPNPDALVHTYLRDCRAAFDTMDKRQGIRPAEDNFFNFPAA